MARNDRKKQIIEYKAVGHTSKETAEHFGISPDYVRRICSGVSPQLNNNDESTVAVRIKEKTNGRFKYISGYKNKDSNIRVMCLECGEEFERTYHHLTTANSKCPYCSSREAENKRRQKILDRESIRIVKKWGSREGKQLAFKACVECGTVFLPTHAGRKCCSVECSRKRANRKKDKRINNNNIVDRDITLAKLYSKDSGRCYICGCMCDWDDKVMDGNGNTIVGKRYPTIEHVQPLSKGGKHSWANVKLACFYCNTVKSDTPPVVDVN